MKKIIYGESNFKKIKINNDYLYIEKVESTQMLVRGLGLKTTYKLYSKVAKSLSPAIPVTLA